MYYILYIFGWVCCANHTMQYDWPECMVAHHTKTSYGYYCVVGVLTRLPFVCMVWRGAAPYNCIVRHGLHWLYGLASLDF